MEFDRYELSVNNMIAQKDSSVNQSLCTIHKIIPKLKNPSKLKMTAPTAIDRYYAEAIRENRASSQIFALTGDMYSSKMGDVYLDKERVLIFCKI